MKAKIVEAIVSAEKADNLAQVIDSPAWRKAHGLGHLKPTTIKNALSGSGSVSITILEPLARFYLGKELRRETEIVKTTKYFLT